MLGGATAADIASHDSEPKPLCRHAAELPQQRLRQRHRCVVVECGTCLPARVTGIRFQHD